MSEEVWNTLDNFSKYEISSFGNIRNSNQFLNPERFFETAIF